MAGYIVETTSRRVAALTRVRVNGSIYPVPSLLRGAEIDSEHDTVIRIGYAPTTGEAGRDRDGDGTYHATHTRLPHFHTVYNSMTRYI